MTGVNLPAVIQVLLTSEPLTPEVIDVQLSEAKEYLMRVDPVPETGETFDADDADDDFFG